MTGNVHFNNVQFIGGGFGRTGNVDIQFVPRVEESWVRNHLYKPSIYKSMGPDEMQLSQPKELADLFAKSVSTMFERSCRSGSPRWVGTNTMFSYRRVKREIWETTHQSGSLLSLGKWWMESSWKWFPGQGRWLRKAVGWLTVLCVETACLVDARRAAESTNLILARCLTSSPETPLWTSWRFMNWANGLEDEWKTIWTAVTKSGV